VLDSVNFKVAHPVVCRTIKNEQTNDRRTQQHFYNIKNVETCSYIDIIKLLLCSTVICLLIVDSFVVLQ
jgi:hypothetical protein